MLLGEEAPTVSAALGDVSDAQEAYNDKFAEINSATYEDAEGETETGFRAYLTAEIRVESLMLDAESTAGDAESLAIENYEDQEAVVNALLTITGCAKVSYADLGLSEEEEEATEAESEAAEALELTEFEECCNTRLSTYLAGQEGEEGCAANVGFGMAEQRAAYTSS
jgi:hypothetical protein